MQISNLKNIAILPLSPESAGQAAKGDMNL